MSHRVGVCIDNMGTFGETPDEERDSILKDLTRLGLEPELVFYGHDPLAIPFERQIDLLVVDYGIIATQGGADDWTRRLLQWADEHPGSVLLIWSSMTADGFVLELRDALEREMGKQLELDSDGEWTPPWPANVRAYHTGNRWYAKWGDGDGVDWLRSSDEYLRTWFGVTKKTALEEEVEASGPLRPPSDWPEEDDDARNSALAAELAQPRRALIEALLRDGVEPDAAFALGTANFEVLDEPPPPRLTDLKLVAPGADGGLVGATVDVTLVYPKDVTPKDVAPRSYSRCHACLRESDRAHNDFRCQPCGLDEAFCTCEPIALPAHPMLDGRPVLIGDRLRVTGRKPERGGPTAGGLVTEIRWVQNEDYLWVELGDRNEIFSVDDLERWE